MILPPYQFLSQNRNKPSPLSIASRWSFLRPYRRQEAQDREWVRHFADRAFDEGRLVRRDSTAERGPERLGAGRALMRDAE